MDGENRLILLVMPEEGTVRKQWVRGASAERGNRAYLLSLKRPVKVLQKKSPPVGGDAEYVGSKGFFN